MMNDTRLFVIKAIILQSMSAYSTPQCLDNFLTDAFCILPLNVIIIVLNHSGLAVDDIMK